MSKLNNSLKIKRLLEKASLYCLKGQLLEAKIIYKDLLKFIPSHPEVLTNLGTIELQFGNLQEGISYLNKSIEVNSRQPRAISNLANGLLEMKNFEEAIRYYNIALKLDPYFTEAYYNRGMALRNIQKYSDAISSYQEALNLDPNHFLAIFNLGFLYNQLKDFDRAIQTFNLAISLQPKNAEVFYNRAIAYDNNKEFDKALNDYNQAIYLGPQNKLYDQFIFNKALLNLTTENYREGWAEYESRWRTSKFKFIFSKKQMLDNFSVTHKRIYLWAEQGIGDQILYSSMLQDALKTLNHFIVSIDARMIDLYQRSFEKFSNVTFVSSKEWIDESLYDYHLPIGSLGKFFRNSLDDFMHQPIQYLRANKILSNHLKELLNIKDKLICGITWKSMNEEFGVDKSISLIELLPILKLPNIFFVELQYGDTEKEKKSLLDNHSIEIKKIDQIDNFSDIDGSASLIDACDFVLTVSNTTAHLAGALNKKTYLLVPYAHGKLWYWGENKDKSLWYPSINIVRQTKTFDWKDAINKIMNKLIKVN